MAFALVVAFMAGSAGTGKSTVPWCLARSE